MIIKYKLLSPSAVPPKRMTAQSSGWDLSADLKNSEILEPGDRCAVPTGISVEIPPGFEGQVRPRSGLALNLGLGVLNSPGTIDADYRGEVKVILHNASSEAVAIHPGMRIAQLVICPVCEVDFENNCELEPSLRSEGGFGHTGI